MRFTFLAAMVGVLAGWAGGGRLSRMAATDVVAGSAGIAGLALLAVAGRFDVPGALAWLIAAHLLLLIFVGANTLRVTGLWLVGLGLACNATVLVVNRGTPYDVGALLSAGIAPDDPADSWFRSTAYSHPEQSGDRLVFLADSIPVKPLREVLSFGDLFLAFGLGSVVYNAMTGRAESSLRRKVAVGTGLGPAVVGAPSPARSGGPRTVSASFDPARSTGLGPAGATSPGAGASTWLAHIEPTGRAPAPIAGPGPDVSAPASPSGTADSAGDMFWNERRRQGRALLDSEADPEVFWLVSDEMRHAALDMAEHEESSREVETQRRRTQQRLDDAMLWGPPRTPSVEVTPADPGRGREQGATDRPGLPRSTEADVAGSAHPIAGAESDLDVDVDHTTIRVDSHQATISLDGAVSAADRAESAT